MIDYLQTIGIFEIEPQISNSNANNLSKNSIIAIKNEIDFVIDAIRELGLNSTHELVSKLEEISDNLKDLVDANEAIATSEVQPFVDQFVKAACLLMDELEKKKFASLAVCGAVATAVGYVGWPAVFASALYVAYMNGPKAYMKALEMASRSANKSKPFENKNKRRRTRSTVRRG